MKNLDLELTIKTLTMKAIIKKKLSNGYSQGVVIEMMFKNSSFQSLGEKYDHERAIELLLDLINEESLDPNR